MSGSRTRQANTKEHGNQTIQSAKIKGIFEKCRVRVRTTKERSGQRCESAGNQGQGIHSKEKGNQNITQAMQQAM